MVSLLEGESYVCIQYIVAAWARRRYMSPCHQQQTKRFLLIVHLPSRSTIFENHLYTKVQNLITNKPSWTNLMRDRVTRRWVTAMDTNVNTELTSSPALERSNSHHIPTASAASVTTKSK